MFCNEARVFKEPELIDPSGRATVLLCFSDISVLPDLNMNYSVLAGLNQSNKSRVITVRDCPEFNNPLYQVKRDAYHQQSLQTVLSSPFHSSLLNRALFTILHKSPIP